MIPGLILYTSNRLKILADKLAHVLSAPLASPLQPEIILVQSKGMERWVSMELARHNGICANCRFPFRNH
jgi:exodeoxyribonuclease V gamma subunit